MEYTELGRTGVKVSRIGLGAWQFSEAWGLTDYRAARAVVERALSHGINFFDTAMVYGLGMSETFLGGALREAGAKRDEIVVSTKIPGEFLNPGDVFRAIEKSLKNLGFDYVDVLLAHWPPCWHNFPTCEYARAMEKLVHLGKVNYLGLSDYPVELVESFRSCLAREDVQVLQLRYNLAERWAEKAHIPYAEKYKMTVQAWSPIAKGALTGKYEPGKLEFQDVRSREPIFHPENYSKVWELVKLLRQVGEKYGKKPVQVALNWLVVSSPVVIPIPGAKSPEQVDDIVGAVGWRLSYSDWKLLEEASRRLEISYSVLYVEKETKIK
ncbi:aldo/keto reductase [Pyrofollis japonicus]|uniref:aldo/keto reductase n=1 Tax=Pyrofollis japonicus TaxID=3060460 RepID=UPI00295A9147|nr:aldo/keto reductase [Pyrofollis japonicus]BEP18292.1 aldo/keto reductase [Pyrofollis japonicus]